MEEVDRRGAGAEEHNASVEWPACGGTSVYNRSSEGSSNTDTDRGIGRVAYQSGVRMPLISLGRVELSRASRMTSVTLVVWFMNSVSKSCQPC